MGIKGPLFRNRKGNQFYYSPLTNRIIPVPNKLSSDNLVLENGKFKFGYNREKVLNKLSNCLESLVLEGTQDCNLRCNYCIYGGNYDGERVHRPFSMDLDVAEKASEFLLAHSNELKQPRIISFYGGEPLLNFSLIENLIKKYQNEKKLMFSISTNGTLLKRHAPFLQENKILVAVSIDGPSQIHDRNRKFIDGRGSYDTIIDALSKFDETFIKHNLSFSATLDREEDLMEAYSFFSNEFPDNSFRIGFAKFWDSKLSKRIVALSHEDFVSLAGRYQKGISDGKVPSFLKFFFDIPMTRIHERGGQYDSSFIEPRGFCVPGTRKLFVKPDGKFYTCEKLGSDFFEIGNIEDGIDETKVFNLLDEIYSLSTINCSNCWATPLCDSCLMVDASKEGILDGDRLRQNCEMKKTSIIKYLGLYIDLYNSLGMNFMRYLEQLKGGIV